MGKRFCKKCREKIRFSTIMILAGICLLFFSGIQTGKQGAGIAYAQEIKIGVVDLNKVFEKYNKRKALDKKLQDEEKQYQSIINEKKKELVTLREKIQLLDLGSDARRKNEETFEKKNMELESYAKFAEKSLLKSYKDYFEDIYLEIYKEIESLGKKEGYDLILKKEETELQGGNITELQFKVGIRTVLYNSSTIDITERLVDILNSKYTE